MKQKLMFFPITLLAMTNYTYIQPPILLLNISPENFILSSSLEQIEMSPTEENYDST